MSDDAITGRRFDDEVKDAVCLASRRRGPTSPELGDPPLPVIGVPVPLKHLDGMDSLLSIVQMPGGVPVAAVSVGGARNAGLLAVRILGSGVDEDAAGLRAKMVEFQGKLRDEAHAKGERLRARRGRPTGFGIPRN